MLARAYEQYERQYVTDELRSRVRELSKDVNPDELTEEFFKANPDKHRDLIRAVSELNISVALAKEMFLIDNDCKNGRELCNIWFEDCNFDEVLAMEYEALQGFLLETFADFFLKHVALTLSGIRGINHLTSETNQPPT